MSEMDEAGTSTSASSSAKLLSALYERFKTEGWEITLDTEPAVQSWYQAVRSEDQHHYPDETLNEMLCDHIAARAAFDGLI